MRPRGFTLVEVMVSVMIFSVVMTVALGALLAMSESDRKAQALKSVINNLNFSMESMTRTIRTGYNYHCGTGGTDFVTPGPQNCDGNNGTPSSSTYFALRAADGSRVAYCLDAGYIKRHVIPATDTTTALATNCASASVFFPLTSSEVTVASLQFVVTGACPQSATSCTGDSIQPKVTILINGSLAGAGVQSTPLSLEASVTQRIFDQ